MASKLVAQWLKTVKGEQVVPLQESDIAQIILNAHSEFSLEGSKCEENSNSNSKEKNCTDSEKKSELEAAAEDKPVIEDQGRSRELEDVEVEQETLPVLKITLKDGKQIISQVDDAESKEELSDTEKAKDRSKNKQKTTDRKSSSSSKSTSSKHSSKSHSSSSDKYKSSNKSSSSSSSRHKSKDDKTKDKERHSSKSKSESARRSGDKSSTSSSKSKEERSTKVSDKDKLKDKEKSHENDKSSEKESSNTDKSKVEKNKDTQKSSKEKVDKIQTPSIQKLGKIPKLNDVKKEKPSISIEVRKPDEPKPKTVKTFHSKFRKHGLEEEVKPPPSRAALLNKKVTPALPPTVSIPKRPSPVHNETPPEKKPKIVEPIEKPGSIKLIPPKPKRKYCFLLIVQKLLLMVFIFTGDISSCVIASSALNSLVSKNFGGKSKMYNLSGSRLFKLLVKNFLQIKAEFIHSSYVSFNIDLNLFKV